MLKFFQCEGIQARKNGLLQKIVRFRGDPAHEAAFNGGSLLETGLLYDFISFIGGVFRRANPLSIDSAPNQGIFKPLSDDTKLLLHHSLIPRQLSEFKTRPPQGNARPVGNSLGRACYDRKPAYRKHEFLLVRTLSTLHELGGGMEGIFPLWNHYARF